MQQNNTIALLTSSIKAGNLLRQHTVTSRTLQANLDITRLPPHGDFWFISSVLRSPQSHPSLSLSLSRQACARQLPFAISRPVPEGVSVSADGLAVSRVGNTQGWRGALAEPAFSSAERCYA
jgi:hypothetical protein